MFCQIPVRNMAVPAEFPSRICQIIVRKQWMACSKYARKRRECGDCMATLQGVCGRRLRSGLKEQEESWCVGLFRLFDGLQARERYPPRERPPSWTKFADM